MSALTDSVGNNGANLKQDVMRVQRLLRPPGSIPVLTMDSAMNGPLPR